MKRRERTRRLIELGGLVSKAGLIELTSDDRAVVYGALLEIAVRLVGDNQDYQKALWRRRGKRAFEVANVKKRPDEGGPLQNAGPAAMGPE